VEPSIYTDSELAAGRGRTLEPESSPPIPRSLDELEKASEVVLSHLERLEVKLAAVVVLSHLERLEVKLAATDAELADLIHEQDSAVAAHSDPRDNRGVPVACRLAETTDRLWMVARRLDSLTDRLGL
jgi:hypothetical protein